VAKAVGRPLCPLLIYRYRRQASSHRWTAAQQLESGWLSRPPNALPARCAAPSAETSGDRLRTTGRCSRLAKNGISQRLRVAPMTYSQPKYVTCLDLGAWGAVFTEGWDRQMKLVGQEAKDLKRSDQHGVDLPTRR